MGGVGGGARLGGGGRGEASGGNPCVHKVDIFVIVETFFQFCFTCLAFFYFQISTCIVFLVLFVEALFLRLFF